MCRGLASADCQLIHHLHRGGDNTGGDNARYRLARAIGMLERDQRGLHRLGLAHNAQRDLGRDSQRSL